MPGIRAAMRDEREDDLSLDEALSAGEAEFTSPSTAKVATLMIFGGIFTNIYHTNQLIIPGSPKLRMVFMELKYHACCQRWFLDTPCNHSSSDRTGEPGCLGLGVGNSNTLGKMIQFDYCARFFQKGLEPGDISPIFPENFGKSSTQSCTFW